MCSFPGWVSDEKNLRGGGGMGFIGSPMKTLSTVQELGNCYKVLHEIEFLLSCKEEKLEALFAKGCGSVSGTKAD